MSDFSTFLLKRRGEEQEAMGGGGREVWGARSEGKREGGREMGVLG